VDPSDRRSSHLIALVVGLRAWETVDIIHKGANYGYSLREGPQQLLGDNSAAPLPENGGIPVLVDGNKTDGAVSPTYPVIAYPHTSEGGVDAIANGTAPPTPPLRFVYRGKQVPACAVSSSSATLQAAAFGGRR
jgi:hypothetical protein